MSSNVNTITKTMQQADQQKHVLNAKEANCFFFPLYSPFKWSHLRDSAQQSGFVLHLFPFSINSFDMNSKFPTHMPRHHSLILFAFLLPLCHYSLFFSHPFLSAHLTPFPLSFLSLAHSLFLLIPFDLSFGSLFFYLTLTLTFIPCNISLLALLSHSSLLYHVLFFFSFFTFFSFPFSRALSFFSFLHLYFFSVSSLTPSLSFLSMFSVVTRSHLSLSLACHRFLSLFHVLLLFFSLSLSLLSNLVFLFFPVYFSLHLFSHPLFVSYLSSVSFLASLSLSFLFSFKSLSLAYSHSFSSTLSLLSLPFSRSTLLYIFTSSFLSIFFFFILLSLYFLISPFPSSRFHSSLSPLSNSFSPPLFHI